MKNNLIRGIRQASDFLMALQLTGAFKKDTLSNLQVRLPAVVIGGGLTGVDSATEIFAYYPVQVEKMLGKFETIAADIGEEAAWTVLMKKRKSFSANFSVPRQAIRAERRRAEEEAGEEPNFVPLVQRWGEFRSFIAKRLQDSPAYRLNHEEVSKSARRRNYFVELMSADRSRPGRIGAVKALVFEKQIYDAETGKFSNAGEYETITARTVCVAAGTSPNVIYEKEKPGTFALDEWRQFFQPFKLERNGDGKFHAIEAAKGETGFFTSYEENGNLFLITRDNHPQYAAMS